MFVAELRQRLGLPDAVLDAWCPRCDCVLDRFSYHAGLCSAGGERTLRHHALRDVLCSWAERAGLQPEREKPGLLLPQRPEDSGLERRRPADIYVPSYLGSPVAFDLAVTGPQRLGTLGEAARSSLAAAIAYAETKRAHLDTAAACQAQGVRFVPLVVETSGAWEPEVLVQIARAVASREGEDPAALHAELLQELSVAVRSFRAKAALRRRAELAEASAPGIAQAAAAHLLEGLEARPLALGPCSTEWFMSQPPTLQGSGMLRATVLPDAFPDGALGLQQRVVSRHQPTSSPSLHRSLDYCRLFAPPH